MSHVPVSIVCALVAVVAWPLAKLFGEILARRYWRELREIESSLINDPRYGSYNDGRLIERQVAGAASQPLLLLLPAVVFFGGIAFSVSELIGQSALRSDAVEEKKNLAAQMQGIYGPRPIVGDDRFRQLSDLSFVIAVLNSPVCMLLTLISLAIVAPLILFAGGLRASMPKVVVAVLRSSAIAALTFGSGMGPKRAV